MCLGLTRSGQDFSCWTVYPSRIVHSSSIAQMRRTRFVWGRYWWCYRPHPVVFRSRTLLVCRLVVFMFFVTWVRASDRRNVVYYVNIIVDRLMTIGVWTCSSPWARYERTFLGYVQDRSCSLLLLLLLANRRVRSFVSRWIMRIVSLVGLWIVETGGTTLLTSRESIWGRTQMSRSRSSGWKGSIFSLCDWMHTPICCISTTRIRLNNHIVLVDNQVLSFSYSGCRNCISHSGHHHFGTGSSTPGDSGRWGPFFSSLID